MTERADQIGSGMPCTAVLMLAYEYLDGEMAPAQAAGVEVHLGRCPECRDRMERERAFLRSLRASLCAEPCPSVVRDRIREAMRNRRGDAM